jgi:hypothetical protein
MNDQLNVPYDAGNVPVEPKPEWLRVNVVVRCFGLSRSKIYELIAMREIKSISLRKRGAIRGVRLINADSLRSLLEREAETQR